MAANGGGGFVPFVNVIVLRKIIRRLSVNGLARMICAQPLYRSLKLGKVKKLLASCRISAYQTTAGWTRMSDVFPPEKLQGGRWALPAGVVLIMRRNDEGLSLDRTVPGRDWSLDIGAPASCGVVSVLVPGLIFGSKADNETEVVFANGVPVKCLRALVIPAWSPAFDVHCRPVELLIDQSNGRFDFLFDPDKDDEHWLQSPAFAFDYEYLMARLGLTDVKAEDLKGMVIFYNGTDLTPHQEENIKEAFDVGERIHKLLGDGGVHVPFAGCMLGASFLDVATMNVRQDPADYTWANPDYLAKLTVLPFFGKGVYVLSDMINSTCVREKLLQLSAQVDEWTPQVTEILAFAFLPSSSYEVHHMDENGIPCDDVERQQRHDEFIADTVQSFEREFHSVFSREWAHLEALYSEAVFASLPPSTPTFRDFEARYVSIIIIGLRY